MRSARRGRRDRGTTARADYREVRRLGPAQVLRALAEVPFRGRLRAGEPVAVAEAIQVRLEDVLLAQTRSRFSARAASLSFSPRVRGRGRPSLSRSFTSCWVMVLAPETRRPCAYVARRTARRSALAIHPGVVVPSSILARERG